MTQTRNVETGTDGKASQGKAGKKVYQHPVLRHYGDVRLLTRGTGATANGDGGQQMMFIPSDRSVKQHLAKIGEHPLGIGIYLFEYRPEFRDRYGHGRQFGVMADEVETVMPEAVSAHPDGYKMVNYALLGITPGVR